MLWSPKCLTIFTAFLLTNVSIWVWHLVSGIGKSTEMDHCIWRGVADCTACNIYHHMFTDSIYCIGFRYFMYVGIYLANLVYILPISYWSNNQITAWISLLVPPPVYMWNIFTWRVVSFPSSKVTSTGFLKSIYHFFLNWSKISPWSCMSDPIQRVSP